eukprot:TRINITY_DN1272_c0_g3_i1.p1 TRINITY_DN1272_c0_g3~~TRINITY_DN1272_c0_g3_i1.p1  ORF type:complete len:144 (+),score=35.04 TRINITY_DN1272_c0_g3_i1:107-538(+)
MNNNNNEDIKMNDNTDLLEEKTINLIETLRQVHIIISDFSGINGQQENLNKLLGESVINNLKEIDDLRDNVNDVQIPFDILRYIDEGKNPDQFTIQRIEECSTRSKILEGKISAITNYKNKIEEDIKNIYVDDYEIFKALNDN